MPSFLNTPEEELSAEILVPRLGDVLIEKEIITPKELQQALEYQKLKAAGGHPRLLGRSLLDLGYIDRETLDKVIVTQILSFHDALQHANQQLEQRVQERTQDLEKRFAQIQTTSRLAQMAVSGTSMGELLDQAVELVVEHLGYDHAIIYLLDETGKIAVLRTVYDSMSKREDPGDYKLPLDTQSVLGWVARQNQTLVIPDIHQESLFKQSDLYPTARSEAGIPILLDERLLGILHVLHSQPSAFDKDTVTTLETIANLISSHIHNQTLLATTQNQLKIMEKRVAILEILNQISKAISSDIEQDDLFKLVHQQLISLMGEVDFSITIFDTNTNDLQLSYPTVSGSSPTQSIISDQELISRVIQTKSPLHLGEEAERQAEKLGAPFVGTPARSWLGAPLLVGGDAIGAIVVRDSDLAHRFDEDDQRLISNLATQIAITVQNKYQLVNARRQAEHERIASEISSKLWAAMDVQSILRTAVKELTNKLEAVEGVIHLQPPVIPNGKTSKAENGNNKESS